MASIRPDRLPRWTLMAPVVAVGVDLALHGSVDAVAGAALACALLAGVMAAVDHAEVLAARLGDPFGAIVLALAVTVIEPGVVMSVLLGDHSQPAPVRDTIHAVAVLVLHGLAGLCIVVGASRHHEVPFRTQGAQAYLTVLLPTVAVTLVLPNFTASAPGPCCAGQQFAFASIVCLGLRLALGTAVASIGLTVPTVAAIAWLTGTPLALGVDPLGAVLLPPSFIMAVITCGTGRASPLSGIVHLMLLAIRLFLIVVP